MGLGNISRGIGLFNQGLIKLDERGRSVKDREGVNQGGPYYLVILFSADHTKLPLIELKNNIHK